MVGSSNPATFWLPSCACSCKSTDRLLLREKILLDVLDDLLSFRLLHLQVFDVHDLLVKLLLMVFVHLLEELPDFSLQLLLSEV